MIHLLRVWTFHIVSTTANTAGQRGCRRFYWTSENQSCIILDGELTGYKCVPYRTWRSVFGIPFICIRKDEVPSSWAVIGRRTTGNRKILHSALNSINPMTAVWIGTAKKHIEQCANKSRKIKLRTKTDDGWLVSTHVTRQACHRIIEEVKMTVVVATKTMF